MKQCNNGTMKRGFTLIEVILAIFIFMVGISTLAVVIEKSVASTAEIKSKLIASYLSQEGIEVARSIRDSNWLAKRDNPDISWDAGLAEGVYEADYQSQALSTYSGNYLNQDGNGFYSYSSGVPTIFKRKITISEKTANSLKVSSRIEWEIKTRPYNIEAVEYLYNWK